MRSSPRRLGAGLLLAGCAALPQAGAQTAPAVPPEAAASAPARDALTPRLTVIEDDNVRIEETRLRGQGQRIVVHDKRAGTRGYEILVAPMGRDPAQDRGAAGQRAWSLLNF